jgi:hypothetical protein
MWKKVSEFWVFFVFEINQYGNHTEQNQVCGEKNVILECKFSIFHAY